MVFQLGVNGSHLAHPVTARLSEGFVGKPKFKMLETALRQMHVLPTWRLVLMTSVLESFKYVMHKSCYEKSLGELSKQLSIIAHHDCIATWSANAACYPAKLRAWLQMKSMHANATAIQTTSRHSATVNPKSLLSIAMWHRIAHYMETQA